VGLEPICCGTCQVGCGICYFRLVSISNRAGREHKGELGHESSELGTGPIDVFGFVNLGGAGGCHRVLIGDQRGLGEPEP